VAPAVITMAPAQVGAQVSTPLCQATLQLDPPASSSMQFFNVRWKGTGYTPNGTVAFQQPTNWTGRCRGIVVVPGSTFTADAFGNFDVLIPKTAFSFSVVVNGEGTNTGSLPVQTVDQATGCASPIINYTVLDPGPGPSDSLTLLYVPSPVSSPLAPHVPPVPGESGSGTVLLGQCHSQAGGTGLTELRFTLNGATPNRTFTLFITPSASAALAVGRTVTTDAAGNASFAAYIKINNGVFVPGDPNHVCFGNLSSATLSLTIDGNSPGASNVAYQSTLVRNDISTC
jgi:hypothetical protein